MKVLVINAGSSSVKYHLYQMPQAQVIAMGLVEKIGEDDSELSHFYQGKTYTNPVKVQDVKEAIELILQTLVDEEVGVLRQISEIGAVGHRVVHGGEEFIGSVIIDDNVIASIEKFADLAPLHNPPNLAGIRAAQHHLGDTTQVACFDTAFHHDLPRVAQLLPIPRRYEAQGVRRYGFHGLSYAFLMGELARLAGTEAAQGRVVLAHLGNGASLAAVRDGKPVDTSMGLTPAAGVPMGTRSGDLDPGLVLYLARTENMSAEQFNEMTNSRSGLLGISETSSDMRDLLHRETRDVRAAEAVALFCYQIKKCIGAFAAALGGLDTLVFAGGIGENAPTVRARICDGLEFLGIELEEKQNAANAGVISADAGRTAVRVIHTDEERMIAETVYRVLDLC